MKDILESIPLEVCDFLHAHEETVKAVNENIPDDEKLYDLAELYKIFGDSTRIKILYTLLLGTEICVCDISKLLSISQSAVSHQLKILRYADLVKPRRVGKTVFYSLSDDHVKTILNNGLEHINE